MKPLRLLSVWISRAVFSISSRRESIARLRLEKLRSKPLNMVWKVTRHRNRTEKKPAGRMSVAVDKQDTATRTARKLVEVAVEAPDARRLRAPHLGRDAREVAGAAP